MSGSTVSMLALQNVDLVRVILSFLPVEDLLDEVQFVQKCFSFVIPDLIREIKESSSFIHLTRSRKSDIFINDNQLCRRIASNRTHLAGGFLLLGGSFGSLSTSSYWIRDNPNKFEGVEMEGWDFFDSFGSSAMVVDNGGSVRSFGGWATEETEQFFLRLGLKSISFYDWARKYQSQTMNYRRMRQRLQNDEMFENELSNEKCWISRGPPSWCRLPDERCYSGASLSSDGKRVYLLGGCENPYRQARLYRSCLVADISSTFPSIEHLENCNDNDDDDLSLVEEEIHWRGDLITDMQVARGGHSVVTLPGHNGNLLVVGGYGGGLLYHRSVEMWDWFRMQWLSLPDMHEPRSGMAVVMGTDNAVYVAGGSPDGSLGHRSLERFDPREGKKWHKLADMILDRGYISGAHGGNGLYGGHFYVTGGLHQGKLMGGMEYYDARRNAWHIVPGSCSISCRTPEEREADAMFSTFPADDVSSGEQEQVSPWFHGNPCPREGLLRAGFQMLYTI